MDRCTAVMTVLAVNEALLDDGFRPYAARIALVAALLGAGFVVAARWPTAGAVVVAGFYPLGQLLGVPGPGGAGLIAVLVAMAWAGYADPPARSRWALVGAILVFVGTDIAVRASLWDKIFFSVIFLPAVVARNAGEARAGALPAARRARRRARGAARGEPTRPSSRSAPGSPGRSTTLSPTR